MAIKGIIFTTIGSVTVGGVATSSYYGITKKTILDELKNEVLISDDKQDWENLLTKNKTAIEQEEDSDNLLGELKNKKDKDELERWCKNSYSQNYYTIFGQHPKSEKIKTLTKKICLKTPS